MNPDEIQKVVDKWTPKGFEQESLQKRLLRALLNANAAVLDLQLVNRGELPIRPLESYPLEN